MKLILMLSAVLAFVGFSQAATTVQMPVTFNNNLDKSFTATVGTSSVTVPASIMAWAPMGLNMLSSFLTTRSQNNPLSLPVQVSINDDGSIGLGSMGITFKFPATTVNQMRGVLKLFLTVTKQQHKNRGKHSET